MSEMSQDFLKKDFKVLDFLVDKYKINLEFGSKKEDALTVTIFDTEIKQVDPHFNEARLTLHLQSLKKGGWISELNHHDLTNGGDGWDAETREITVFTILLPANIEERLEREKVKNNPKEKVKRSRGASTSFNFYFNQSSGNLSRYPQEKNSSCSFVPSDGRYKIMTALIRERDEDIDRYVSTSDLTLEGEYKDSDDCRKAIHAMRKIIEKTFKGVSGFEFIEVKQRIGYRIGKRFEVYFEDTP